MRILELILHRYTRLSFSAIETIHYKPTADVQIIIGTNGSGKSSFLNELNPLPPSKNYMLDGGYKTIRIEHRGIEYTLHSSYGKHIKHSFIEHGAVGGDIELNDGGTGAAQKILIEKIFGLDIDLLKIWLGRTRFTDLTPIKRRDWILKLSGSDLDVAMRLFQLTKNETRDAQALEKHFVHRLAEETADIADQNRVQELEDTVKRLTTELNQLLEHKDNRIPSVGVIQAEIDVLVNEFNHCTNQALNVRLVKPSYLDSSIQTTQGLREFISNAQTTVKMMDLQLQESYEQKDNVLKAIQTLSLNGVTSTEELEIATKHLLEERQLLVDTTPIYDRVKDQDPNQLMGRYQSCRGILIETLAVLPDNTTGLYSRDKLTQAREKVLKLKSRNEQEKERRGHLLHALQHFKDSRDEQCPKCDHIFKPGLGGFDPHTCERELATLHESILNNERRLKLGQDYIDGATEYARQVNGLKRILSDNPELESLWELLVKEGLYRVHPQSHFPTLNRFQEYLQNCVTINSIDQQIKINQQVLSQAKSNADQQSAYSDTHLNMLDQQIGKIIAGIDQQTRIIEGASKYCREVEIHQQAITRALEIRNTLADKYDLMVRSNINRTLSEVVQSKQVILANANGALNKITRHDAVIQEIIKQKDVATENHKNLSVILKALSPTEGLISKYIQNFLDVFIEDVNIVIGDIWTSDLEVLSCGVDSSEVNCKFPLSVNDGYLITPDISESSDGQRDIINFAFRMVVGEHLDLHDFPLYLDELAPTLDEQHRENLIRYLNKQMEDGHYQQMFMISHYASNHYAFANSEILMMDGRNIINKPGNFNSHVKITYSNEIVEQFAKIA